MKSALPPIPDMLARLVATPSVSCTDARLDMSNLGVIELLAAWAEDLGFACRINAVGERKYNLIATRGQGIGGLVLAGHTDTVPYDEARWQSSPFELSERQGRWYGLGTADMKGFFPLALTAAAEFSRLPLSAPLILLATCDEESSMSGAQSLSQTDLAGARYALIGEPTNLRPIRMHKGVMMESLSIRGHSGHSSDPSLGVNAIDAMHLAMGELIKFREELRENYHNPVFGVPFPTLNLGCLHGGDNPNRICPHCELQFDLRPLPGMNPEELRAALRQRLLRATASMPIELSLAPLFSGTPAMETRADAAIVKACESLTGQAAGAVAFGTEAPYLNRLGLETVVLGPGNIGQAHQPDEYLSIDQASATLSLLRALIRQFCLS